MAIRRPDYPGTQLQPMARAARVAGLRRWENGFICISLLCPNKRTPQRWPLPRTGLCEGESLGGTHTSVLQCRNINPKSCISCYWQKHKVVHSRHIVIPIFPARQTEGKRLFVEQAGDKPEWKPGSHRHRNLRAPSCTALLQAGLSGAALEYRNQRKLLRDATET